MGRKKMTSKCIICGATFPSAVVYCKGKNGDLMLDKPYPKQICNTCAAQPSKSPTKSSGKVYRYPTDIHPYVRLAGAIEYRVLSEYRTRYEKALDSADAARFDMLLTDDEEAFLLLHKRITGTEGAYHQALTLSNLPDLLDAARRDAEQSDERFRRLKAEGYDIFRRWEVYKAWKAEQDAAAEQQREYEAELARAELIGAAERGRK